MVDWNQASTIATAIGTMALAIFAGLTLKGLKDQMNLLYIQANAMQEQSNIMHEKMEYDLLVRRYERLNKTMIEFVAPLFSKKDNYLIFVSGVDIYPPRQEYTEFWEYIMKNIYLADKNLYSELQNYFSAIDNIKIVAI